MVRCERCKKSADRSLKYPVSLKASVVKCARCTFRQLARRHLGKGRLWTVLRLKFDGQGGRCAYTGERLVLGENASIDHKQPKALGGKGSPENLQWVTHRVNKLKQNFSDAEFVALCRKVSAYSGGGKGFLH